LQKQARLATIMTQVSVRVCLRADTRINRILKRKPSPPVRGNEFVNFSEFQVCDTVVYPNYPNYVASAANRNRLWHESQAQALELALDAADTIGAQDSLEKC
jgi:hypothetical protein